MAKVEARIARLEHKHPFWVAVNKGNLALTVGCFDDFDRATLWARDVVTLFSTLPQAEAELKLPPDDWDRNHVA